MIELMNPQPQTAAASMRWPITAVEWPSSGIDGFLLVEETAAEKTKLMTIEVQTTMRSIIQAKAKATALLGEKHRKLLRRWAEQAGLCVSEHV